ncbi:hypothetical protein [uncultured Desulfobulbus sp.]|uniref:hypothetical protein n=1 Tax=uncultured Desulfobulbus sp. TaxID=239745 RepID=UPI0029C888F9|nr:hypothetical protein [uncultured Desulfobulbus sp.]
MKWQNGRDRLGGWLGHIWQHYQDRGEQESHVRQITDYVVQIADPVIRQAKGYRKVLHEPIAGSMEYCQALIDAIPGPVVLDKNRYYDDPLVKALFASPDELEEVLRLSPDVNALRKRGQTGEVVALLTMTQQEKTIFGHQQEGEMLVRDVRQQAVSFFDHRIVAPAADLALTKAGIVNRGLEVLATVAMEQITTLRSRKAELQGKKEYLKGIQKILGGKNHVREMFASRDPVNWEELRKAEKALAEVEEELERLREHIATPEQSLGYLEAIMRKPGDILEVHNQFFRLNWMGVRVDDGPGSDGNDITLAEFSLQEEFRRSAVLVSFALGATSS